MKRAFLSLLCALFAAVVSAPAQQPLYIVNGEPVTDIASIPPEEIERVEELPADEQTVARYGQQASHGVILVTLRYDRRAAFPGGESFDDYIARQVQWPDSEPAARVVLRYRITAQGRVEAAELLQATDKRLKRRVLKAVAASPAWQPARKAGRAVESEGVLRVQLPEGKPLPRQMELILL